LPSQNPSIGFPQMATQGHVHGLGDARIGSGLAVLQGQFLEIGKAGLAVLRSHCSRDSGKQAGELIPPSAGPGPIPRAGGPQNRRRLFELGDLKRMERARSRGCGEAEVAQGRVVRLACSAASCNAA